MSDIWFGTREHMQWVPAWATGPNYGRDNTIESAKYLNGGAGGRFSRDHHRTYDLVWNAKSREGIRRVVDYADGVYGDDLIYWSDPLWTDTNALPQRWAMPYRGTRNAPPLLRDARPQAIRNPAPGRGYPTFGARYTKRSASASDNVFIPIPPGHDAWIGVHGEANAEGVVTARRYERTVPAGPLVKPVVLPTDTQMRVNTVVNGGAQAWVEISLDLDILSITDSFDLYGLMVQVLPVGTAPEAGDFITGQAHSGCEFKTIPNEAVISTALDRVSTSATLIEVGSWL